MKNLVVRSALILSIAGQIACSSSKNIVLERRVNLNSVDLTEYAKAGFLVTPHGYGGDYDALSFFQISGHDKVIVVRTPSGEWRKAVTTSTKDNVTLEDALEAAVFFAKEIGGDAITGVRWSFGSYDHSYYPALPRDNVQLSGWVIKRNLPGNISPE